MVDDRAQFQTEAAVGGHQGIAGDLRSHLAVAQDEVRQDGEHRFAPRTLDTPDRDSAKTDAHIMGVARQASAPATGRFVFQLKAKSEEKSDHTFDKRFAIAKQLKVRGCLEIKPL